MSHSPPPMGGSSEPLQKVFTSSWQDQWNDCGAEPETCLLSCCCPCVQFGKNYAAVRPLTYGAHPQQTVEENKGACCLAALAYMGATYFCGCLGAGVAGCFVRQEIKKKYGITTGECSDSPSDFLLHCCCQPCALSQEWRELKFRADQPAAIAVPGGSIVGTRVQLGAQGPPLGVPVAAAYPQQGPVPAQPVYGSVHGQPAYVAQPPPGPQAQPAYYSGQPGGQYPAQPQQQHMAPGGPPPHAMAGPQQSPAAPPAYNPNQYPGNASQQHMSR